ncbi:MAG: aspartate aminotransferase family protein [Cohaesibacteraceae bacterium]|nr:aspartate aminotransferase family protein [Cohaesibacteraceae bacterium]MBL4876653.1 aspartate aminotransferase family protein [Cohaesibacteraceae bacterium]
MSANALFPSYARANLSFVKGEGAWLESTDGRRYLDFAAGIAVNSLGHAHPHLVEALKSQAENLWHVSNVFEIPGQERLGQRLVDNTFADAVFFGNSGGEAMECAFKSARRYHYENGDTDRYEILTFEGAFHGRTLATIAAGGNPKYMTGFGPKVPGFTSLPLGDIEVVKAAISDKTAAILIEPIQGEGGIRLVPTSFMKQLRAVCDEHGLLLILDEIQCGVGRTGKFFAYEWSGISPDIMAIAKGIGGGFPMGACLAVEKVAKNMVPGTHGSTFGGNPMAMAVGNAVLDVVLKPGFLANVQKSCLKLKQKLAAVVDLNSDILEEIRGEGLMLGLKSRVPVGKLVDALRDAGLLVVGAGEDVARLLPPLIINDEDIAEAVSRIEIALKAMRENGDVAEAES